ncbi:MAG: DNA internalization-related competence protein ComEC/Rec2 [Gammaproteobacteria bacterium]|nr:DNA internalization-related competence protein ComEC/Rec2 [Gammaproteobacteria bacterium]
MRAGMLAFCLGVWLFSRVPVLPPWPVSSIAGLLLLTGGALTALLWRYGVARAGVAQRLRTRAPALVLALVLALALGMLWSWLLAARQFERQLPRELEGVDFWVTGAIAGLPSPRGAFQQFELDIISACFRLHPRDCPVGDGDGAGEGQGEGQGKAPLTGARITLNEYASLTLAPGEHWRFRVRLNRPHGFANPGGYDYEAALFQQGIVARGYVRDTAFNTRLSSARPGLQAVRAALRSRLYQQATGLRHVGVLSALMLGDRDGVSDAQWQLLSRTGTNHLLVISGLHVGFVAMTAYALVNLLVRVVPRLLLWLPAQHYAALASVLAALIYSALAGFSLPTQRALVMVLVVMSGQLLGRRFMPSYSLLLAATLVLLLAPMSVTQAGFWLSFTAVGALLFAFTGYRQPPARPADRPSSRSSLRLSAWRLRLPPWRQVWQRWLQPQWVVSVGLLLPLLLWTGQVSLVSPLANVLAIPLVSLLIVPLTLVGALLLVTVPGLAIGPLWLADRLLSVLFAGLEAAAAVGPALWQPAPPTPLAAALAMLAVLLMLAPRGLLPTRTPWLLPLCLLTPLIWPAERARPAPGTAQIQFLDVGQGLAVVVHTRHHHLLFDTGPALGPQFDAGRAVIVPYLRRRDVRALDMLIISHAHQDHSGGAASVAGQLGIRQALAGGSYTDPLASARVGRCRAGQRWQWDGVDFEVLHPSARTHHHENDNACALLISAGGQRALLTGDIEAAAERELLSRVGEQSLRADILQVPHHGSASSSSAAFIRAVQPSLSVISAGYRNRFGHPAAGVVQRLRDHGSVVCQTPRTGAVQIELGVADGPRLSGTHRQRDRRFWHNIPPSDYGKVATVPAGGDICGRNRDGGRLVDAADNSVFDSGDCDCH